MFRKTIQTAIFKTLTKPVLQAPVRKLSSSFVRYNAFGTFLKEEVRLEKEGLVKANNADMEQLGFKVEVKGAECVLEKSMPGSKIMVSFNVNGSVAPIHPDSEEDVEPISYPDFTVHIEKDSSPQVAEFECFFADGEEEAGFHVRSCTVAAKNMDEQKEAPYFMNSENLDPAMYSEMIKYLNSLGLNQEFSDRFIDFATGVETEAYVNKLEELEKFVSL